MEMFNKCIRCKHKNRPKHTFPCSKCISDNLPYAPVTCKECRYSHYGCIRRGKNQRKMNPCEEFQWS